MAHHDIRPDNATMANGGPGGRVLVLGGTGLLGQALGAACAAAGISAVAPPRSVVDLTDADALRASIAALEPAVTVNAAAFTGVDAAEERREECRAVNERVAATLAAAVAEHGGMLIQISTDFVFDGEAKRPYREDDAVAPVNWYGATKEAGERAVRAAGCRHLIIRTAWLHGVARRTFVQGFAERLLAGQAVEAVNDRTGSPTAADDLAGAVATLTARLCTGGEVPSGTYHFAGRGGASPYDVALDIAAACGADPRLVRPVSAAQRHEPARRPRYVALDCGRAASVLGLRPRPWREGVRETLGRVAMRAGRAA